MGVMGGIWAELRSDEGSIRWYVWAIIVAVVVILLLFAAARTADSHMLVGTVESMNGNMATVGAAELNRSFTAESVDPDLKVGTTVIVQVQGDSATLEATSPQMVKLIVTLKGLVP
jgi:hypothetical protein